MITILFGLNDCSLNEREIVAVTESIRRVNDKLVFVVTLPTLPKQLAKIETTITADYPLSASFKAMSLIKQAFIDKYLDLNEYKSTIVDSCIVGG